MKKRLSKSVLVIILALFSAIIFSSCSDPSNDQDVIPRTVYADVVVSSEKGLTNTKVAKVLDKLKEFQFISRYDKAIVMLYQTFSVKFEKTDVLEEDVAKVKAELNDKAHKHYEEALGKVNSFDFSTLFPEGDVSMNMAITVKVAKKEYTATIKLPKP